MKKVSLTPWVAVLLGVCLMAAPAYAQADITGPLSEDCDALCRASQQNTVGAPRPYDDPLTCFYFEQVGEQAVPFFIYDAAGDILNPDPQDPTIPKPEHRKLKQSSDSYCIGRQYIESAALIVLCNDSRTAVLVPDTIRLHLEAGDRSPQTLAITICLMEGGPCEERLATFNVPE